MPLRANILKVLRPFCRNFDWFRLARGTVSIAGLPHTESSPIDVVRTLPTVVRESSLERFRPLLRTTHEPLYAAPLAAGWADRDGAHLTARNLLVEELSLHYRETLRTHKALRSPRPFKPCYRHDGTVLALTGKGYHNYYHWMLEILPKLDRLRRLSTGGELVFAPTQSRFHCETLSLPGIGHILSCEQHDLITAPLILAASIPRPFGHPHPHAVAWLRETFLSIPSSRTSSPRKLLINRQNARTRRIANIDQLRRFAGRNGFTEVTLESMSFAEQVRLFRHAEFILAPHGAGLTNLVWCDRGTRVIELLSDLSVQPANQETCFWALGNGLNLPYAVLECTASPNGLEPGSLDLSVNIADLEALYTKFIHETPMSG